MNPTSHWFSRRALLQGLLAGTAATAITTASRRAMSNGRARRLIVFYFPDGIAGRSQDGMGTLWWASGAGSSLMLSESLQPLEARKGDCVFVRGLHMGSTDEGSHPGGAKKLLTNKDGGGSSIDQHLANTVGREAMHRHLYLGVQANANNASGDKFISYPSAGVTVPPEDDPIRAFRRLFGSGTVGGTPQPAPMTSDLDDDRSVIDTALADLSELKARAGASEAAKLDLHLEALRELETRLRAMSGSMMMGMTPPASCSSPRLDYAELTGAALYAPENFPRILKAQTDLMVTAMACGLTKVGVIQNSQHTSELIMSRFMGSEMFDAGFDMRSHQASHYGARQDRANRLFTDYIKQRRWWVSQFAYLLEQLRARPEGDGTMLDNSVVLLCSEVSDGNTHSHSDMPFVVAGRGGGCVSTGRVIEQNRRHGDLLAALAGAMGERLSGWGDGSGEWLPGLVT